MYNKVQDSGMKEAGSGKCNFNNKITLNINNKMKVSGSRLTADSSAYVFECITQNPLNAQNAKPFVQSCVLQANLSL